MPCAARAGGERSARHSSRAPRARSRGRTVLCVAELESGAAPGAGRRAPASSGAARQEDRAALEAYRVAVVDSFLTFAAFLRLSEVWAPNFFVNRSTRPSVSISF